MSRLFGEDLSGHYVRVDSTPISAWGCTAFGWMRPNNQTDGLNGRALTAMVDSTYTSRIFAVGLENAGGVYISARNTTWYENLTTNLCTGGAWNALAGTWTSATVRTGYLARLTDTSYDTTTGTVTSVTVPTVNRLCIGHLGDASPNQEANGAIAHVAWWNVVLTAGELEMLLLGRVSPLAVRPQSLVFYAPYLGRNTSEIDIIGGRILSVSGATASVEEPPLLWTPSRKKFFLYSAPVNRSGSATLESVATITASISANTGKGITIDSATLATCEAESTTADKVDMLISLMADPVVVKVYNGLGSVMGSGTMESPWAIRSGDSLVVREVVSFAVTTSGTPDDSWYLRFESGSRWVRGAFGLASANRDFSWSLDTWVADQTGTLGTVVLGPPVSSVPQLVGAPTSLSYLTGIGGTHDFSVYGVDPDDDALLYSIVSSIPTGHSMSSAGLFTVQATAPIATNSLTIRVSDATGLYTDYSLSVSVLSASVSATTLRAAGYVLAIDYDVDPTGTEDSWAGLQAAIDYAESVKKPLYISSGTYLVSKTIRIFTYNPWYSTNQTSANTVKTHYIQGNTISRPVIKLMAGATNFQDPNTPYPVICERAFAALNANAVKELWPDDPFGLPANTIDHYGTGFDNRLAFVNIDTNQNPGAIGLHWSTCQDTNLTDVRIVATGSLAGMNGAGGTQGVANIEIEGGQYGWICRKIRTAEVGSGSCLSGMKIYNQTVACVEVSDYTPITFVGFHFKKPAGGVVVDWKADYFASYTRNATPVFVDGVIESPSGIVFDNPGATMYIRNVYVTGSGDLIKSGAQSTVTGTGTWKRIAEYAYTNQSGVAGPFVAGQYNLKHWSIINGTKASTPEPATTIENSVAAPSAATTVAKHTVPLLPRIDNGTYCDVRDYGAVAYDPVNWNAADWGKILYQSYLDPYTLMPDARAGINAAIAAAEVAGHNRVFLPRGIWYVSGPIELRAHTQLFGTGTKTSCIAIHHSWAPTTGRPYVVTTPSDVGGTASMNNIMINTIRILGTKDADGLYSGDRFSHVLWRVGRYSFTFGVNTDHQYYDEGMPTQDRQLWTFNGGGGGRHWFIERDGRGNCNPALRVILADATTEPLSFYGPSMETGKGPSDWAPAANLEVRNARNVRVYNTKREGNAATIWVNNSTNVAHYGAGVQMSTTYGEAFFGGRKAYMAITGASNNVLIGVSTVQDALYPATTTDMVREVITGLTPTTIVWQEGLSLYKRGTIDDSAMVHTVTGTPPPVITGTVLYKDLFDTRSAGVLTTSLYDGAIERWRKNESTPISTVPESQMEIVTGGANRYFRTTIQKVAAGEDAGNYRTELTLLESQYQSQMTSLGSGQWARSTDLWFGFRWQCTRYDNPPSGYEYVGGYLCQWHNQDSDPGLDSSRSPPFALWLDRYGVRAYLEANADNGGSDYRSSYLVSAPFVGSVYDFMFRIRWDTRTLAQGSTGAIDLYINDGTGPAWSWRGQTCHPYPYTNGLSPYFRFGMYMGYWRSAGFDQLNGQTFINNYDAFTVSENGSLALVKPSLPRTFVSSAFTIYDTSFDTDPASVSNPPSGYNLSQTSGGGQSRSFVTSGQRSGARSYRQTLTRLSSSDWRCELAGTSEGTHPMTNPDGTCNPIEYWIGYSQRLVSPWPTDTQSEVILQWHGGNTVQGTFEQSLGWDLSPVLCMLSYSNGEMRVFNRWCDLSPGQTGRPIVGSDCYGAGYESRMVAGALADYAGIWADWVWHIVWDWRQTGTAVEGTTQVNSNWKNVTNNGGTGRIEVWSKKAGETVYTKRVDYTGPVGTKDYYASPLLQGSLYYLKYGLYKRGWETSASAVSTRSIDYDNVKVIRSGGSFNDVAPVGNP